MEAAMQSLFDKFGVTATYVLSAIVIVVLLLVLLLIEMGEKDKWSQRFMNSGQGRVSYDKVMCEAERAMTDESYPPELQSVISDIKDMYQSP